MLCESCQDIFRGQRLLVTSEYGDLRSKEFRYRGSKSSIRVAASNGCELCEILCSSFDAEEDAQPAEYPHLEFWIEAPAQLKAGSYFYRLTFMWRTPHRNLRNEIDYKFLDLGIWKSVDLEPFLSREENVCPHDTGSPESLNVASKWFHECLDTHPRCNQNIVRSSSWYPTRLLDLETPRPDTIHLITSQRTRISGPYVTLSHCWGKAHFLKLTRPNIQDFEAGILLDKLPKTFRDAVIFTKHLGIRYLWIDSLCIFQDSLEEWRQESTLMSKVYTNAICNIGATASTNSEGGLFRLLDKLRIGAPKVEATWEGIEKGDYFLTDETFWGKNVTNSPLLKRAWVIQEMLLARRVVHFGKDQILWECSEKKCSRTYPAEIWDSLTPRLREVLDKNAEPGHEDPNDLTSGIPYRDNHWSKVLTEYSEKDLTNPDDREAAIFGIIKALEPIFQDTCIAGIWTKMLPSDLLWVTQSQKIPRGRPEQYRAPSWSWLSVDNEVTPHVPGPGNPSRSSWETLVTIEEIKIFRESLDSLSRIQSGYIKLWGCLREAQWCCFNEPANNTNTKIDGISSLGVYSICDAPGPFEWTSVYFLLVETVVIGFEGFHGYGLILKETGKNRDEFERLGMFSTMKKSLVSLLRKKPRSDPSSQKLLAVQREKLSRQVFHGGLENDFWSYFDKNLYEDIEPRAITIV